MDTSPNDRGLDADLSLLLDHAATRRHTLRWLSGLGGAVALGRSGDAGAAAGSCSAIPAETAGPFPADGSNASGGALANALALSGIVRSDIRASIAGANGVAAGVPLALTLTLVDTNAGCAGLEGAAVYLWHCDALGRYSMYSSGVTTENYLRGVQAADAAGRVTFKTVFPGCYGGRWPHVHLEVYRSLATATSHRQRLRTSQLALPQAACRAVYATRGYAGSAENFAGMRLADDFAFADDASKQMPAVEGSAASGYVATLQVGIAV
jgi:protocatechuate 3,4-dioxygenase beta subunit